MLDEATLRELYIDRQMTGKEIAKIAGVNSPETIYNWLRKYGIPRRQLRDAQRPNTPDKETLEDLYINQEISIDAIARMIGSSESSISKLLDQYDIPKRTKWEKFGGWNKGQPLPEKQRQHLSKIAKKRTGKKSPRYGVTLPQSTRQKIANSLKGRFRGTDNPQWNGGPKYRRNKWHNRYEYKDWRQAVFERDNYTCQLCGKPSNGDIEAHHIKPFDSFPDLRFDIENGITLCQPCHQSIKGKELNVADKLIAILHQATL